MKNTSLNTASSNSTTTSDGDNIGALLRGVQRTEIERGQVLAKPGTVHCHTKFTAPGSLTFEHKYLSIQLYFIRIDYR